MRDEENTHCAVRVEGYTPLWMLLMPPDSIVTILLNEKYHY